MAPKKIDIMELNIRAIEDCCPNCDSSDFLKYTWNWADNENLCYEITCKKYGLEFKQWYKVEFVGQQVGEIDILK